MPGTLVDDPRVRGLEVAEHATALGALGDVQNRLHSATSVGELLADAPVHACAVCGFERGVALTVRDGELGASGIPPLADPASDRLRRIALEFPVALSAGSDEAELIRRGSRSSRPLSRLQEALGLEANVVATIAPESRPVAVLVLDRRGPAVDDGDRARVELFAHLVGLALERVVLRSRLTDLALELRHFTVSANALAREALDAPITASSDHGSEQVFAALPVQGPGHDALSDLLTGREREILELMVSGMSNRDIGQRLHLSPHTVKAYVARVLRKLGAANRVEAVSRYIALAGGR